MMQITSWSAAWFLPFVAPLCAWVIWSDLSAMRIPNKTVLLLTGVFVVIGLIALPLWPDYPIRLLSLVVVLIAGMVLNAIGLMGAGDSKFIAAAAPFIAPGDAGLLAYIFGINVLACYVTHRVVMRTSLRNMAPDWISWERTKKFPLGFSLAPTLVIYLGLGILYGA
ncbi:MAG: prepilin peptidase [Pseudomonadota bacterium]